MADPLSMLPPGFVPVQSIDQSTGAPARVRAAVGAAPTPQDRLSTIRKFFPDAQPYGEDNFVYTDPKTGRKAVYNPKGLDWGDPASLLPEYGEFAGGAIGGMAATLPAVAGAAPTGGGSLALLPAGIGLGAAGGREIATLYANRVFGTDDTRNLGTRLADAAMTGGMNAIGARAGDLIGQGVRSAAGPVRSALMGSGQQVMDDFTSQGIRPTAGAVTGNRGWQMLEKGLAATPGGSRVMQDIARQQWDDFARAVGITVEDIGEATTPQQAGSIIRTGAQKAAERFKGRQEGLYDEAFNKVGADTPVDPTTTTQLLADLEAELAKAPQSRRAALQAAIDRTRGVVDDSQAGVGMDTWRRIRTDLGRDIDQPLLAGSTGSQNEANKRLYGALTDDMRATTAAAGPDAKRAMDLADRYTRFNLKVNMPTLQKIADMNADELAWQYATGEAGKGGSRLLTLRKNLTPDEWRVVAATVFDRLGLATPGARGAAELGGEMHDFSISTFLTNWNKLSPEAKSALFGGKDMKETREAIDQLVRVANRVKDVERMSNPSGTARGLLAGGSIALAGERVLGGDLTGAAGIIGGSTIAPYITAKMITNPAFVRWLSGASALGKGGGRDAMIGRLGTVAAANPEIREELLKLQAVLQAPPTPATR